jgi:hypothetical protein
VHDALAGLVGVTDGLQGLLHPLGDLGGGGVAGDPGQVEFHGRESPAHVVVDLAGDGGALLLDAGLQVLGELTQLLARAGQGVVGALLGDARAVGLDGQQGGRGQAGEVAFEQVVVGPRPG